MIFRKGFSLAGLLIALCVATVASAQPTAATVGLNQGAQPQAVVIKDRTGAFVPIEQINSNTHLASFPPPSAAGGSITLTPGSSPTSTPPNGSMWCTNVGCFAVVNGSIVTLGTSIPSTGAGGTTGQVQYNCSGILCGVAGFTWDGTTLHFPSGSIPGAIGGQPTLAQAKTLSIGANQTITVSGFRTVGDSGAGARYTSVGATSTGWGAFQDSGGVWFNLVLTDLVNVGWFGPYGDDGSHTLSSADISANPQWRGSYTSGMTWDYVATQEAIYAAFASASTPGNIVWNNAAPNYGLNKKLYVPTTNATGGSAKYGINNELVMVAANISIEFANSATCWDWKGANNVSMFFTDSIAYGSIWNPCLQTASATIPPGGAAPLWDIDHDGTYGGLSGHLLMIFNANIGMSFNGQGIAINPVGGGGAQGDDIIFINPEFAGFAADYCIWFNGANALGEQIIGGDMQGCQHDAIRNTNAAIFVRGTTFENQATYVGFSPVVSQITTNGADFHSTGDFGGFTAENKMEDVRSEGTIGMLCDVGGNCLADDLQINGGDAQGGYFASYPYYLGNTVGIISNGFHHAAILVDDGGPATWLATGSTSTACSIVDNTQTWTTNQWAGYILNFRFSNGFTAQAHITANSAHALTLSPCLGFTPPTGAGTGLYHISGNTGSSAPSWNSLPQGHYATTLNGSIGYGFSTTASSTTVSIDGNTLATPINVGDYVVIPGADEICNIGTCIPYPLYAHVISINSGASTIVVSKAAALTVAKEAGYFGTALADNQVKWLDLPYPAMEGLAHCQDSNAGAGLMLESASKTNCGGAWESFDRGSDTHFAPASTQASADYGPRSRTQYSYAASLTGGTFDLTPQIVLANDFESTLVSSTTLTIPTVNLPGLMTRDETLVIRTIGAGGVLTFGTGFNSTIKPFTATGTDEVTFRFVYNVYTAQWDEIAGPNLAPAGINGGNRQLKLGKLLSANFNSTADQAITLTGPASFALTNVLVTNCSASLTTAAGAFWTGAGKTGDDLFGTSASAWSNLTGSAAQALWLGGGANNNKASLAHVYVNSGTFYLSLTTPQGSAATCDVYAYGVDLD